MNKDGLEGRAEEVHGEEGKRVFHQDLLIFLGVGAESEERPQQIVCYRAGVRLGSWIWGKGGRVKI